MSANVNPVGGVCLQSEFEEMVHTSLGLPIELPHSAPSHPRPPATRRPTPAAVLANNPASMAVTAVAVTPRCESRTFPVAPATPNVRPRTSGDGYGNVGRRLRCEQESHDGIASGARLAAVRQGYSERLFVRSSEASTGVRSTASSQHQNSRRPGMLRILVMRESCFY